MMLLLHGLPNTTKYHDIKILVKRETNLNNFILDDLMTDNDGLKKVTIGVADEQEGAHLMKCLNGYRVPPGNVLRIIPMGKSGSQSQPMNASQQTSYDQRGFPPRNSYQPNPEPVYNRSMPSEPVRNESRVDPWGPSSGQRNQWTPNQSAPSQGAQGYNNYQGSGNMMSGQQAHSTPQHQRPEMRPNPEMRPYQQQQQPQDQRYGYQPKNNVPDPTLAQKHQRSHFLRSVEIIDEPIPRAGGHPSDNYPDRHPQQKPITIMKDNFQGPQYGLDRVAQPSTQYQGHNQSPWGQPMPTQKINPPYDRKYPEPEKRPLISKDPIDTYKGPTGPRFSPRRDMKMESRFSPRKDIPKDMGPRYSPRRDMKPGTGPRFSPRRDIKDVSGPRFSPRRDIKDPIPSGPRFSPRRDIKGVAGPRFSPRRDVPRFSPRRDKDGPRFSPRRDMGKDPGGPGPRFSPSREVHMPHGRRPSPGPRRMSPSGRRISPGPMDRRRRESPPGHRRISPGRERYSPSRHLDKGDKYPDRGGFKEVRPAYEPPSQASNQAMYSGGYRPSVHENVQYPIPGVRPDQRPPTWQENKSNFPPAMKKDDDRDVRMPKFEPRIEREVIDKRMPKFEPREAMDKRSPIRKSRSPRRDRSPIRDRFKKHSPSPRSPRRSWALEKRRSPEPREPPPPPMWPGQNQDRPDDYRGRNFEEEKPRMPVWERPSFDDKMDRPRRPDERAFEDARRPDLVPRRPVVPETRPHFEATGHDFRRMEDDRKPFARMERREESPRREERKIIVQEQLHKEIDDVYKRAVEFHKRVEERKSSERRRNEFDDRSRELERHGAKEMDYRDRRDDRHDLRRYDEPRRDEPRNVRDEPRNVRDEPRNVRDEPRNVRDEPRNVRDEPRNVRDEPRNVRDEPRMREAPNNRQPEWRTEKDHQATLSSEAKAKREKAVEEISQRILGKHGSSFNNDLKRRVQEELKVTLSKLIREMFGEKDVSFIEMVIKFNAKYDVNDEKKIFDDVMSGFPSQYRNMKRAVEETVHHVEVPPKTAKMATDPHLNRASVKRPSRPPSRKYEQHTHRKMPPPTYKPKPYPISRARDPSVVRKRPYPLERPKTAVMPRKMSAPLRRVPEQIVKAVPKSAMPTSKSATATSKSATPTSKSATPTSKSEMPTSKSATPTSKSAEKKAEDGKSKVEESKVGGNKMDFDDDLDIKGLREEPASEGHYQLNPLMSRVLEKELQTIMIKVWQDLPDKPPNAAEKAVVDKLRTEAGDDLKNVLGLNVSKRLLNIHNPLYVKVVLSRKPDRVSLKEFVKTYNCIGLKYVPSQSQQYTFVAQFKHFSDFDKICTTKIVRCGNERVSIIPCYKFTTCPPHLKSVYSDNSQKSDRNSEESQIEKYSQDNKNLASNTEGKESTNVKTEAKTTGEQKVTETNTNTSANQPKKDNVINKETKPAVTKVEVKKFESQTTKKEDNQINKPDVTPTKVAEKAPPAKVTQANTAAKTQTQNTTAKTQPENASQVKATPTNTVAKTQPQKTTPTKAQPEKTAAKTQAGNTTPAKVTTNTVAKAQPQKTTPNSQPQKAATANSQPQKATTPKATQNTTQKPTPTKVAQIAAPQNATNNTKVVAQKPKVTKTVLNKKPVAKTPQKATVTKKTKEDEDITAKISEMIAIDEVYDDDEKPEADEDVLDDEDILALMSGAIVLDECRGSDEE